MDKFEFIGFHATSQKHANRIIKEEFIINKNRNNDWLGHGIYLFMYRADADSWAKGTYYCQPNPSVIKCFVKVEKNKYLDLDDPEALNNYDRYYNEILKLLSEKGKIISFKNKYEAMCWGLNIYKKDNNIDVVKYTFINSRTKNVMKYVNNKSGYKYNEVQICISRNDVIVKKELCS